MKLYKKPYKKILFTTLFPIRRAAALLGRGAMPDFIIIGAQRCGTTSLYHYLTKHPRILPALSREVHYFDINFDRHISWYQAFFPLISLRNRNSTCPPYLTGEASPYYIFHPHVPHRISKYVPQSRLISILRNPVDRAYSHFLHETRIGEETLSFEEAIAKEEERIGGEELRLMKDENYDSFYHRAFSYLSRGIYHKQIAHWLNLFDREQMLVIISEEFFANPQSILSQTLSFLGINDTNWNPKAFVKHHYKGPYPEMKPEMRRYLIDYFKPHNQKLAELLGLELPWDN